MPLALKALWLIDGFALGFALIWVTVASRSQDSAGRGMMWALPIALAIPLALSWALRAASESRTAMVFSVGVAALPLLVLVWWTLSTGASTLATRRVASGAKDFPSGPMKEMARAIAAGDTATMKRLKREGSIDLNAPGLAGQTLLGFALEQGHAPVPTLIGLDADVRRVPADGIPYLVRAIEAPAPVFDAIAAAGADLDVQDSYGDPIVFHPLTHPDAERALALVRLGADVKALDARGRTTLMQAVQSQLWDVALALLDAGVDPSHVAPDGTSVTTIMERLLGYLDERSRTDTSFVRLRGRLEGVQHGT